AVGNNVHTSAILQKMRIVLTPEPKYTARFVRDSLDNFFLVVRQVIGNIHENIANELANCQDGFWNTVVEIKLVLFWHLIWSGSAILKGNFGAPVDRQNHDASQFWPQCWLDRFLLQFHVDEASKRIYCVSEVKAFVFFGKLLPDTVTYVR